MSEERIKLIWDLRSIDAKEVAEHHVKHLREYIASKDLVDTTADCTEIFPHYYVAFILTSKEYMIQLRDDLKPHRGEYV
ncbi:MAG: hypothetical protein CMP61_03530 [Flavobacteriales bacterium]|nr:hypothetical protein [Flavobacteriales bacterium]|tara:strand:+ start:6547 stop:6783 length:237 start_codon:yes stop_codon:yes gene_type:complete